MPVAVALVSQPHSLSHGELSENLNLSSRICITGCLISLACVGCAHRVWTTLGFPQLMACGLSWSTLFRLQVAVLGNCPMWALGCVHLPDLSHSGSGFPVLHKGTNSVGPAFCAPPGPSSSGDWMLGECTLPRWVQGGPSYLLPVPAARFPGCAVGAPSHMCRVSPLGS